MFKEYCWNIKTFSNLIITLEYIIILMVQCNYFQICIRIIFIYCSKSVYIYMYYLCKLSRIILTFKMFYAIVILYRFQISSTVVIKLCN